MALKVKPNFSTDDVKRIVLEKLSRIELAVINRLRFIGEQFVKNARENANFTDRTGNLRSSIGFVIVKNGEIIDRNFQKSGKGTDGSAGADKALKVAQDLSDNFPSGIVLIVVAGMEYAAAVESKNYDVITASSLVAESDLKDAISTLMEKISKMQ